MPTVTTKTRDVDLVSRPDGVPTSANFKVVEREIGEPNHGFFLVRNEWISVDPYMRGRMRESDSYVPSLRLNEPVEGGCIGRVIQSLNPAFAEGDYVLGHAGWREHWFSDGEGVATLDPADLPPQAFLGVLGLTGMTAWVGLNTIGKLKSGDCVYVSAASGAVGSIACQIAKLKGCDVIGSAGSAKKTEWLKQKAGVDHVFNYHETNDISSTLAELCPNGIDLYFDNVGGSHLEAAINNMNDFGRIVCCGMISAYNDSEPQPGPNNLFKIIAKRIHMQGFIVRDHLSQRDDFLRDMIYWIRTNRIVWEETIVEGLENAPAAFINLFHGDKMGKALVRV
ncbi:MAG: NADP-dependent oxidoreductase [Planctomycetaceae bacterium]